MSAHSFILTRSQWRIQGGGGPPIDRMHFKTSENFALKCIISA